MPQTMTVEQALELVLGLVAPLARRAGPAARRARSRARRGRRQRHRRRAVRQLGDGRLRGARRRPRGRERGRARSPSTSIAHIAAGDDPAGIEVGRGPGRAHHDRRAGACGCRQRRHGRAHSRARRRRRHRIARRASSSSRALGEHIRRRGEEVRAGDVVLHAGEVLGPGGDRPARVDRARRRGRLPPSARGRASRPAASSSRSPRSPVRARSATPTATRSPRRCSRRAASRCATGSSPTTWTPRAPRSSLPPRECDFIVTSGGVSVGDFDYVKPVLEEIGELDVLQGQDASRQPADARHDRRRAVLRPAGQPHEHVRRLRDLRAPGAARHAGPLGDHAAASRWRDSRTT